MEDLPGRHKRVAAVLSLADVDCLRMRHGPVPCVLYPHGSPHDSGGSGT